VGDWLGRVPQVPAPPRCLCSIEWATQVPGTPTEHAPMPECLAGSAYLGCESAWEPGKRSEWRTSHLTGYGMESSGHSRALEHAGSGPQREQRHRENRH
jgi:hypothetical protein